MVTMVTTGLTWFMFYWCLYFFIGKMIFGKMICGFLNSGITHGNDGLLHRAVAKLMPGEGWSSDGDELRYQELLEELDDLEIDGVEMDGIEIDGVSDEPNSG